MARRVENAAKQLEREVQHLKAELAGVEEKQKRLAQLEGVVRELGKLGNGAPVERGGGSGSSYLSAADRDALIADAKKRWLAGQPLTAIARDLKINATTLYGWKLAFKWPKQSKTGGG